jgi:hypothetical protein
MNRAVNHLQHLDPLTLGPFDFFNDQPPCLIESGQPGFDVEGPNRAHRLSITRFRTVDRFLARSIIYPDLPRRAKDFARRFLSAGFNRACTPSAA